MQGVIGRWTGSTRHSAKAGPQNEAVQNKHAARFLDPRLPKDCMGFQVNSKNGHGLLGKPGWGHGLSSKPTRNLWVTRLGHGLLGKLHGLLGKKTGGVMGCWVRLLDGKTPPKSHVLRDLI